MRSVHDDRQRRLLAATDGIGGHADTLVRNAWAQLLRLLKDGRPSEVRRRAPAIWREMLRQLAGGIHHGLEHIAQIGYASNVTALKTQGPAAVRSILFPPLHLHQVLQILRQPVAGSTWQQDLSKATKLASPDIVGNLLAFGLSQGKTPRQVATTLLPVVDGVQSSARRISRTFGMQVAHHAQMQAHAKLGNLIIGYQIFSAKVPSSRPWHVERSGTIYYAQPTGSQKGYRQLPHPPLEAEDPKERPPGTPQCAWNCMCFNVPVLRA